VDTIVLRGGPRERGRHQGTRLRESIRTLSARYEGRVLAGCREADVRPVLANMLRFLEERFPELLEELRGVAEGSALSFDEVARLNFGSAIVTTLRSRAPPPGSCSRMRACRRSYGSTSSGAGKRKARNRASTS
jgi:hypothetical protein